MPIVHAGTFRVESASELLLNALRACVALFVNTPKATQFVASVLHTSRDILVHEFVSVVALLRLYFSSTHCLQSPAAMTQESAICFRKSYIGGGLYSVASIVLLDRMCSVNGR